MANEWNQSLSSLGDFIASLIIQNKQKSERERALGEVGKFFQTEKATYSPQSFARPQTDQYGVPRVTQPMSPQSVNFQTVPTVPSPNDWGFISALINAAQLGVPTGPITEAAKSGQKVFETLPPGTVYGERTGTDFTPKGQAPFKPPDTSGMNQPENPNQWLADSLNPILPPERRQLAKQKYDQYVSGQGQIAGVRAEASHPFTLQDRKISTYTNREGKSKIIWQRPSGETYETESEETRSTEEQLNRTIALSKVDPVLKSIDELSEKINTQRGVIAKISGGVERAKAEVNLNDDVAEYNSIISGFTPLVARAVGHTGVLTEQDVQSVRELFPKPGDSKSLRDRKINRIKTIMTAIKEQQSSDTTDIDAEMKKLEEELGIK